MNKPHNNKPAVPEPIVHLIHWLTKKISDLFSLEVVEVTFNDDGYTYTKVAHN